MVARLDHARECQCDGHPGSCDGDVVSIAEYMRDMQINLEAYHDEDSAIEAIQEDPLCVEVRSGWYSPGDRKPAPTEYQILLCTGGPAVRIVGLLTRHGEPDSARLEYQDWGTPWTESFDGSPLTDKQALLAYAHQFYFGG